MITLTSRDTIVIALNDPDTDPDLRGLVEQRLWQLYAEEPDLGDDDIRFVVIQGGDTPSIINDALGFQITGHEADALNSEWMEAHGLWFEIALPRTVLPRTFVFVENSPATELGIHYLCLSEFWTEEHSN